MYIKTVDLYKAFGLKKKVGATGVLTAYINENTPELNLKRKRPAMLIIPGGAYHLVSDRENQAIAIKFLAQGYNCFVLNWSGHPDNI